MSKIEHHTTAPTPSESARDEAKRSRRSIPAYKYAVAGLFAGLVLAVVGLVQSHGTTDEPAAAAVGVTSLEEAHGLRPIGEVIALWQQRSDDVPLDYISRTRLGSALAAQSRETANSSGFDASETVLREALSINPRYGPAKLELAGTLHAKHEFRAANTLVKEVVDTSPGSLAARALLGDTHLELGQYDLAATIYEEIAQTERSAPVVSRLARIASDQGDNDGAVSLAREALDLSERLALRPAAASFYWFQLGHLQFVAGDTDGALASLNEAREIAPDSPAALEKLALAHAGLGNNDVAASLYRELLAAGPAADLHGAYADVLLTLGNEDEAAQQNVIGMALALETIDKNPAERRHLAGFLMTRDPALALQLARDDIAERQDWGAYDTLAWALFNNGLHPEAQESIELALATGVNNSTVLYHAGAIAAANDDDAAARDLLGRALDLNPAFDRQGAAHARTLLDDLG